jgi:fructosamine-3-kinase
LLERLPDAFAIGGKPEPRLIHGDVWSANIIVNRLNGRWSIQGLVDPGLAFADVEYELAYLECFGSTGAAFFEAYRQRRPMREGYEIRKRYYWLNTMLLHVHLFGDLSYIRHTRKIVDQLTRLWQEA